MVVTPIQIGTAAQDWARLLNVNFSIVDYHNHTFENSLQINSQNIGSGDLDVNGQTIRNVKSLEFFPNGFTNTNFTLYVQVSHDLFYIDNEFSIQITSGAGLNLTDVPEGFTVIGSAPVAQFDSSINSLRFFDSAGADTANIIIENLNCTSFTATGVVSIADVAANTTLQSTVSNSEYFGVNITGLVPTYRTFNTSYKAYDSADIYKISQNGVFYYDREAYDPTSSLYDASYYLGAKNAIYSPNSNKTVSKDGVRYFTDIVSYSVGLFVQDTFMVVPLLENKNFVSFIPKIQTTARGQIGYSNPVFSYMIMPTFKVLQNDTNIQVVVDMNLQPLMGIIDPIVTLTFCVIYADVNYSIEDD